MARPSRSTDPDSPTGFYEWPNNSSTSADNPVAILNLAEEKAETYRAIGNMQTEYRLPWVEGLRANVTLGFDASDGKRRNFTPERAPPGAGDRPRRPTDPVQSAADQHGARDLSQLHHAAPGRSGHPRPDRRLLLEQDPHRLDLLRGHRSLQRRGRHRADRARGEHHEHRVRAAEQADLLLRPPQLQHQRSLHPRGESALRRLVAVRRGERLRHVPVGVGRVAAVAGAVPPRGQGAVRPQAPGLLGQDRQSVLRKLPGVFLLSAQRQPGPVSVRRHRLHDQPPQRRGPGHQVGADPRRSTSASTSGSPISGSPARSTTTTS